MKQATHEWLKKAEADYLAALDLASLARTELPHVLFILIHPRLKLSGRKKARLRQRRSLGAQLFDGHPGGSSQWSGVGYSAANA